MNTLLVVGFIAICILARIFRSRIAPMLPKFKGERLSPQVNDLLDRISTPELIAATRNRIVEDRASEAKRVAEAEAVAALYAHFAPPPEPATVPKV